jgi:CheY-like chemotaxis protein
VSRITQGRMQLRRAPVELAAVVRSAAHDLAATMKAARHTLALFVDEGPIMVHGDATRLAQIVLNLLTNAAKYTPDGGRIELHLRCQPGLAEIRVRDNGIGIPPAALGTVFEMFSQLESALERSKGGLGIGLALVRGLVELHGGSIRAESAGPGQGSTFIVSLPLAADAVCPAEAAPVDAAPRPLRVMVVDDNQDAAQMLATLLEVQGHSVSVEYDGRGALQRARLERPQVMLLDIGLPDTDGYALARQLRALPELRGATLVALTGYGQNEDRRLAEEAGFDHHLVKPADLAQVSEILASAQRSNH